MRRIDRVIIHHSAAPSHYGIDEIREWHLARGFEDIGYHYVIEQDGSIRMGRPIEQIGAHCYGLNNTSIGIGLCTPDKPLGPQWIPLYKLVKSLTFVFPTIIDVAGHRDFSEKECPAFDVRQWWDGKKNSE